MLHQLQQKKVRESRFFLKSNEEDACFNNVYNMDYQFSFADLNNISHIFTEDVIVTYI